MYSCVDGILTIISNYISTTGYLLLRYIAEGGQENEFPCKLLQYSSNKKL
jgi:hypothetical protein